MGKVRASDVFEKGTSETMQVVAVVEVAESVLQSGRSERLYCKGLGPETHHMHHPSSGFLGRGERN